MSDGVTGTSSLSVTPGGPLPPPPVLRTNGLLQAEIACRLAHPLLFAVWSSPFHAHPHSV